MITYTREEFKTTFGTSPAKLFDLNKLLTNQHRVEAMGLPDPKLARVRLEYGTIVGNEKLEDLIFAIEVAYWIDGSFKAKIIKVHIFNTQTEQDLHKAEHSAKADTQRWQDN